MGFKKNQEKGTILTLIGKDTAIRGTVSGTGPVRVDGKVQGEMDVQGDVIIGESGVLEASVKCKSIQVAGQIIGNIETQGKLEILATGNVEGDATVQSLQVADGATFQGSCSMRQKKVQETGKLISAEQTALS